VRVPLVLAGLIVITAFAVAIAPARLLSPLLATRTAGELRLDDASGTIWRGSGALRRAGSAAGVPVAWTLQPLPILHGEWRVDLAPQSADMPAGSLQVGGGTIRLTAIHAQLPAALLQPSRTFAGPVTLGGRVLLDVPHFEWDRAVRSGEGHATWEGARIALGAAALDLGTVTLQLDPHGPGISGVLSNHGGEVEVTGTVTGPADALELAGELRPVSTTPSWVAALLAMFGRPDARGAVHFAWREKP